MVSLRVILPEGITPILLRMAVSSHGFSAWLEENYLRIIAAVVPLFLACVSFAAFVLSPDRGPSALVHAVFFLILAAGILVLRKAYHLRLYAYVLIALTALFSLGAIPTLLLTFLGGVHLPEQGDVPQRLVDTVAASQFTPLLWLAAGLILIFTAFYLARQAAVETVSPAYPPPYSQLPSSSTSPAGNDVAVRSDLPSYPSPWQPSVHEPPSNSSLVVACILSGIAFIPIVLFGLVYYLGAHPTEPPPGTNGAGMGALAAFILLLFLGLTCLIGSSTLFIISGVLVSRWTNRQSLTPKGERFSLITTILLFISPLIILLSLILVVSLNMPQK